MNEEARPFGGKYSIYLDHRICVVRFQMIQTAADRLEAFAAHAALVGALAGMRSGRNRSVYLVVETFSATIAWTVLIIYSPQMIPQVIALHERLRAIVTLEFLLTLVISQVNFERLLMKVLLICAFSPNAWNRSNGLVFIELLFKWPCHQFQLKMQNYEIQYKQKHVLYNQLYVLKKKSNIVFNFFASSIGIGGTPSSSSLEK